MDTTKVQKFAAGGVVCIIAILLLALLFPRLASSSDEPATDDSVSGIILASQSCESPDAAVKNLLLRQGFKQDQFVIGEDKFNLSLPEATEEGSGSFGESATTAEGLTTFLGSGNNASKEVLRHAMSESGVTRAQALDPMNWVGFQMLVRSKWEGNTTYKNGNTSNAGTRSNGKGDLGWVLVNPDDCRKAERTKRVSDDEPQHIRTAFVRGGCVNPQNVPPVPDTPDTPDNPEPECPPGSTKPECLTPKDSSKDVLKNPDVPDQVKGPGTTPVGQNPGPPNTPVDSDTGCNGPCSNPSAPPQPSATPTPTKPTPIADDPVIDEGAGGSGDP